MTEKKKWDPERIHQEVYDARTKLFVTLKVLETGNIDLSEHPEWTILIQPLLKELTEYAQAIGAMAQEPKVSDEA